MKNSRRVPVLDDFFLDIEIGDSWISIIHLGNRL